MIVSTIKIVDFQFQYAHMEPSNPCRFDAICMAEKLKNTPFALKYMRLDTIHTSTITFSIIVHTIRLLINTKDDKNNTIHIFGIQKEKKLYGAFHKLDINNDSKQNQ